MTKQTNFESNFKKLENIVETMEEGDLTLEQSLKQFEQGIKLIRQCQTQLGQAEKKVQQLTEKNGEFQLDNLADEDQA